MFIYKWRVLYTHNASPIRFGWPGLLLKAARRLTVVHSCWESSTPSTSHRDVAPRPNLNARRAFNRHRTDHSFFHAWLRICTRHSLHSWSCILHSPPCWRYLLVRSKACSECWLHRSTCCVHSRYHQHWLIRFNSSSLVQRKAALLMFQWHHFVIRWPVCKVGIAAFVCWAEDGPSHFSYGCIIAVSCCESIASADATEVKLALPKLATLLWNGDQLFRSHFAFTARTPRPSAHLYIVDKLRQQRVSIAPCQYKGVGFIVGSLKLKVCFCVSNRRFARSIFASAHAAHFVYRVKLFVLPGWPFWSSLTCRSTVGWLSLFCFVFCGYRQGLYVVRSVHRTSSQKSCCSFLLVRTSVRTVKEFLLIALFVITVCTNVRPLCLLFAPTKNVARSAEPKVHSGRGLCLWSFVS